jgi:hypothetical protein
VRKGGLEPPCLSAPPPQDGVSANFTTSALGNYFILSYLPVQPVRGSCSCTGFCNDPALPPIPQRKLFARQARKLEKQILHRIGLRVNIAQCRLNAIVPGYVLQREGVGVAASLGKKGVSQPVEARIWVGLACGPKCPPFAAREPSLPEAPQDFPDG